jgi:hypothetical protein
VEADALIGEALKSPVTGTTLYGRLNALRSLQQRKIAEIIELLPAMQDRCGQGLSIQSN